MVVQARLDWLRQQASMGYPISVHFSYNHATRKDKVRFHVGIQEPCSPASTLVLAAIDLITQACAHSVIVDRGHRHSDGSADACFWIQSVQAHGGGAPQMDPAPKDYSTETKRSSSHLDLDMDASCKKVLRADAPEFIPQHFATPVDIIQTVGDAPWIPLVVKRYSFLHSADTSMEFCEGSDYDALEVDPDDTGNDSSHRESESDSDGTELTAYSRKCHEHDFQLNHRGIPLCQHRHKLRKTVSDVVYTCDCCDLDLHIGNTLFLCHECDFSYCRSCYEFAKYIG